MVQNMVITICYLLTWIYHSYYSSARAVKYFPPYSLIQKASPYYGLIWKPSLWLKSTGGKVSQTVAILHHFLKVFQFSVLYSFFSVQNRYSIFCVFFSLCDCFHSFSEFSLTLFYFSLFEGRGKNKRESFIK